MPNWNATCIVKLYRITLSRSASEGLRVGGGGGAILRLWHPVHPEHSEGFDQVKSFVCHGPLIRGAVTFLASPRKVTKRRRPRRLSYSCDAQKKAERPETRCAQTAGRSDRFFPPLLGANQRGPVEPTFDRFARRTTGASGLLLLRPCEVSSRIANAPILKVAHHALRVLFQHRHVLVRCVA